MKKLDVSRKATAVATFFLLTLNACCTVYADQEVGESSEGGASEKPRASLRIRHHKEITKYLEIKFINVEDSFHISEVKLDIKFPRSGLDFQPPPEAQPHVYGRQMELETDFYDVLIDAKSLKDGEAKRPLNFQHDNQARPSVMGLCLWLWKSNSDQFLCISPEFYDEFGKPHDIDLLYPEGYSGCILVELVTRGDEEGIGYVDKTNKCKKD